LVWTYGEEKIYLFGESSPYCQPSSVVAIPSTLYRIRATLRKHHVLKTEHLKYAQTLHTFLNSHPAQKTRNRSRGLHITKPGRSEILNRYHHNTIENSVNNTCVYWREYYCCTL